MEGKWMIDGAHFKLRWRGNQESPHGRSEIFSISEADIVISNSREIEAEKILRWLVMLTKYANSGVVIQIFVAHNAHFLLQGGHSHPEALITPPGFK